MSSDDDWDSSWPTPSSEGSDGPDFQPGIDAWERVGLPGQGLVGAAPQNRVERAMMDPLESFRQYVDAIARNLNNWDGVDISEQSIERMLRTAEKIEAVGHKNPTAYILGFLATGGGRQLSKANFNYVVKKVLPHTQEGSVLPPDIIRYARFWEELQ
jgi:hypothetical protein